MKKQIRSVCILVAALFFAHHTQAQLASDTPSPYQEKTKQPVLKKAADSAKASLAANPAAVMLASGTPMADSAIVRLAKKQPATKKKATSQKNMVLASGEAAIKKE